MHSYVHCSTISSSQYKELPKCPLTEEWIKKMWYICVYIYIHTHTHTHTHNGMLVTEKNKIVLFLEMWMDLETVILSEVRKRKISIILNII